MQQLTEHIIIHSQRPPGVEEHKMSVAGEGTGLPASADVIIVGGGIIGAASAFFLGRAGLRGLVCERLPNIAGLSTAHSMEAFRAQFVEPENIAMMRESIAFYERFADEVEMPGYDISLHQQGYLFLTSQLDGPARFAERVAIQHAAGLGDVELLGPGEIRRRFPFVTGEVTAATYRGRDGWLSANEAAFGFLRASGAGLALRTPVTGVVVRGGRVSGVSTVRGTVDTRMLVIAAGPYSAQVASLAGAALPISNLRRHRLTIGGHPLIPQDAPMTIDQDTGAHWRPESGGAALAWAQAHEVPQEPADHVRPNPDFPFEVLEGVARLCGFWEEVAGSLKSHQVHLSAGHYPMSPDDRPIIGAHPDIEGLYFNTGYGGHGVMAAPGGARLLADLVAGRLVEGQNPFSFTRLAGLRDEEAASRRLL